MADENPYSPPRAEVEVKTSVPTAHQGSLQSDVVEEPRGIGGWLLLPLLGLVLTPIGMANSFVNVARIGFAPGAWDAMTPGSEAYDPLQAPLLAFGMAFTLLGVVASPLLLWLFLKRHRYVPRLMVASLAALVFGRAFDFLLASRIPAFRPAMPALVATYVVLPGLLATVWIAYFLRSSRVKNTFVRSF